MSLNTPPSPSAPAAPTRRPPRRESRLWRKTTLRRAVVEGLLIYLVAGLLARVPAAFWPWQLFVPVLLLRLTLFVLPPVWAAQRVVSTRREKMSRRFWRLGPILALCCALVGMALSLALGEAALFGGLASAPDLTRFTASGAAHLSPLAFLVDSLGQLGLLAVYFTIAVVCTRLANGGFLRFTMPAGDGRVTL